MKRFFLWFWRNLDSEDSELGPSAILLFVVLLCAVVVASVCQK